MVDYKKNITVDNEKRFGTPIISGTRISVADVLNWLANGMTVSYIITDFPELNETQINACLSFAAQRESRTRVA